MGVVAQFIKKTGNLGHSHWFCQVEGIHDVATLAAGLKKVIENFGIKSKVHFITTNSASVKFVMADWLEELSKTHSSFKFAAAEGHISCFAHVLNLAVPEAIEKR